MNLGTLTLIDPRNDHKNDSTPLHSNDSTPLHSNADTAATTTQDIKPLLLTMAGVRERAMLRININNKTIGKTRKRGQKLVGLTKTTQLPKGLLEDRLTNKKLTEFFQPYSKPGGLVKIIGSNPRG